MSSFSNVLYAILLSCRGWLILQMNSASPCIFFMFSFFYFDNVLTPRKQWLVDSVWHLFVITVTCCLCFTSFSFVTLRFDEETTVLESYEVVCLMHAPARRRSTDHACLLDPGSGAGAGVGWLTCVSRLWDQLHNHWAWITLHNSHKNVYHSRKSW